MFWFGLECQDCNDGGLVMRGEEGCLWRVNRTQYSLRWRSLFWCGIGFQDSYDGWLDERWEDRWLWLWEPLGQHPSPFSLETWYGIMVGSIWKVRAMIRLCFGLQWKNPASRHKSINRQIIAHRLSWPLSSLIQMQTCVHTTPSDRELNINKNDWNLQ